jgi:hypothetical protein
MNLLILVSSLLLIVLAGYLWSNRKRTKQEHDDQLDAARYISGVDFDKDGDPTITVFKFQR